MGTLTRNRRGVRGLNTVEAALLMPLVLMLTFGAIEYGWMFLKSHQLTSTAREGARYAVLPDTTTTAQVKTQVKNVAQQSYGITLTDSQITVSPDPPLNGTGTTGTQVTVTIQINQSQFSLVNIGLVPLPKTITSRVTMAKEGP